MVATAGLAVLASACGSVPTEEVVAPVPSATSVAPAASPTTTPTPTPTAIPTPSATPKPTATGPATSDGTPQRAEITIAAIGVEDLAVRPYRGTTDDAEGEAIQDRGDAASPYGNDGGGVGPGGVGNYLVTGHRTSSTAPFADLPDLRKGDRVRVESGGVRYVYEIVSTRETSFRSPASLARQRAAVPGKVGVTPTRAMITLSTCATPEDHAAGNYWSDEFGNPEHRIDKIGVLVSSR